MANKLKTRKAVKKRFNIKKSGKILRKRSHSSHLARKDDASSKSKKKREKEVKGAFSKKIKDMIVS